MMRWDPSVKKQIETFCKNHFKLSFNQMLLRYPHFIAARVPRYVPSPSVLVPALQYVVDTLSNTKDAKTGDPLFNQVAHEKAAAVIELARCGYLSDIEGLELYERAGIDQYGLQKFRCLRGTNKVEGGPHADIYRKFSALNGACVHSISNSIF